MGLTCSGDSGGGVFTTMNERTYLNAIQSQTFSAVEENDGRRYSHCGSFNEENVADDFKLKSLESFNTFAINIFKEDVSKWLKSTVECQLPDHFTRHRLRPIA